MVELVIKYTDTQVGKKKKKAITNFRGKNNLYRKRHHKTVESSAVNGIFTVMIM